MDRTEVACPGCGGLRWLVTRTEGIAVYWEDPGDEDAEGFVPKDIATDRLVGLLGGVTTEVIRCVACGRLVRPRTDRHDAISYAARYNV